MHAHTHTNTHREYTVSIPVGQIHPCKAVGKPRINTFTVLLSTAVHSSANTALLMGVTVLWKFKQLPSICKVIT